MRFSGVLPTGTAASSHTALAGFDCSFLRVTETPKERSSDNLDVGSAEKWTRGASFRTTQAELEWDPYEKVIDEVTTSKRARFSIAKRAKTLKWWLKVKKAGASKQTQKTRAKFVLFSGGKIRMYRRKSDQVTKCGTWARTSRNLRASSCWVLEAANNLQKAFDVTCWRRKPLTERPPPSCISCLSRKRCAILIARSSSIDTRQGDLDPAAIVSTAGRMTGSPSTPCAGERGRKYRMTCLEKTSKTQTISPRG